MFATRNACATAGGLFAAAHTGILAMSLAGTALLLIMALAVTAAWSTKKKRRDASYKVLKLILNVIFRPRRRDRERTRGGMKRSELVAGRRQSSTGA